MNYKCNIVSNIRFTLKVEAGSDIYDAEIKPLTGADYTFLVAPDEVWYAFDW